MEGIELVAFILMSLFNAFRGQSITEDYSELCLNPTEFSPVGLMTFEHNPKVIHYTCNTGFMLKGPPKQECTNNGTWDPPEKPTCVRKHEETKCQSPYVLNGNIRYQFQTLYKTGESINVQCKGTYAMHIDGSYLRNILLICGPGGMWYSRNSQVVNPKCTVSVCNKPPDIPNSQISLDSLDVLLTAEGMFLQNQSVYYQCNDGYSLIDMEVRKLTCRHGEWDGILPSCVVMEKCSPPQKINDGVFYLPSVDAAYEYKLGSEVTYKCNPGYKLRGSATLLCLQGPKWSHYPPECVPTEDQTTYCPPVSTVTNGNCFCDSKSDLQFCEPFFWGLHVECVCNEGFKLIGSSIVTCRKDGTWDYLMPTCVQDVEINSKSGSSSRGQPHMSTLAIVVATACSVLGVLLLIMVIMVFRRRKPHPPRLCRPSSTPPPYSRVHSNPLDEHDRVLLIGYENTPTGQVPLPSYEEAIRNQSHHTSHFVQRSGQVGEYRPLPSIPTNLRGDRGNQSQSGDNSNRHSVITTSTINRDGLSEVFGSIDTVNVSMSDASTAVTIETFDSSSSHHSNVSRRGTAGSINSSNDSLANEDAPLIDSNQRNEDILDTQSNDEDVLSKEED